MNISTLLEKLKKQTNKTMENEVDGDMNCDWCVGNNPKMVGRGPGGLRNQRSGGDHYSIIMIDQNTEKSPLRLDETCCHSTLMKDYQLTLVRETHKE